VGSVLIGSRDFIKEARRFRKVMGGGMRQAGYLAAAGIYALDHHVDRLREDNDRARRLGATLEQMPYVESVRPVQSNIVIFDLKGAKTAESFLAKLEEKGVQASPFGPKTVRFVTHLDVTEKMIGKTVGALEQLGEEARVN
jgi:threonine aldolase